MEQSLEDSPQNVSVDTITTEIETLVKRKEDGNAVDLANYQKTLQKIEKITNDGASLSLLQNLPEEVVIKILQLHDQAVKFSWNKLAAKLRGLAVITGETQSHDAIENILEFLLKNKAVSEEINFELLLTGSKFDIVTWIKKGGNLSRLADYLRQFKFTRSALEILHFVMTKPELADVIEKELSVPILDVYLRLTKHKGAALALTVWQTFNVPKYYDLIKQLSPEIKLDWIIFIVQHYSDDFEEKYLDLFKSLVSSVDVTLLPRAFRPGHLLNEHFFIKIMRDNRKQMFDYLMQVGYDFNTFKKKGRALQVAVQLHNAYFVKEILKRKLIKLPEVTEHINRSDLLVMKDLSIYQIMHDQGYDFSNEPLVPNSDVRVDYPFMNALMDWYLSKRQTKVLSLKRLSMIAVKANNINYEGLPHDLRDAIDVVRFVSVSIADDYLEYNEPWYWLNWNDDEANKNYWKDMLKYLQKVANESNTYGAVDFTMKTVHEDTLVLRVQHGSYYAFFQKPTITLAQNYRNLSKGYYSMDKVIAEYLGVTIRDLPVLYGLMSIVAFRLGSKDTDQASKSEQPFWFIYNPTVVWDYSNLNDWYGNIIRVMIGHK